MPPMSFAPIASASSRCARDGPRPRAESRWRKASSSFSRSATTPRGAQGRADHRRYRRQPGARQDASCRSWSSATRCSRHRAARRVRGARDRRLHPPDAHADRVVLGGGRGPHPAQAQSVVRARVGTSAQPNHALGEYAAKTLGYKRVAIIADDFAYGHETAAGFQRAFEDNGGKDGAEAAAAAQRPRLRLLSRRSSATSTRSSPASRVPTAASPAASPRVRPEAARARRA